MSGRHSRHFHDMSACRRTTCHLGGSGDTTQRQHFQLRWVITTETISKMIPFLLLITNWFSWNAIILQLDHDVTALQCKSCWKHHTTWSNVAWKDLVNPFSGISSFPFSTERNSPRRLRQNTVRFWVFLSLLRLQRYRRWGSEGGPFSIGAM